MTVTYDITTVVGKIRLIIGDTVLADYTFTDEELTYFYTAEGSINLAAAAALGAWMAKYAAAPDSEHIGDYSYTQKIIQNMNKLKKELEEKEASTPYLTWSEMDLTTVPDGIEMGE